MMRRSSSFPGVAPEPPRPVAQNAALTAQQQTRRLAAHFVGFTLFCCAWGLALSAVELPTEEAAIRDHKDRSAALRALIVEQIDAGHLDESAWALVRNTCELDLSPYFEPNWRFPGAFFFVVSVVTTIGYGNYVPVTPLGKAFTCVVAFSGVAYCGFFMTLLVLRVEKDILRVLKWLGHATVAPRLALTRVGALNIVFLVGLSFASYATGCIAFGNSVYMSLVTFSTVGLGDYAPPFFNPGRPLWWQAGGYFMGAITCLLGLALLSTFLSAFELWARQSIRVLGLSTRRARRRGRKTTIQPLTEEPADQSESESTRGVSPPQSAARSEDADDEPVTVESGQSMASSVLCFCGIFGFLFAIFLAAL